MAAVDNVVSAQRTESPPNDFQVPLGRRFSWKILVAAIVFLSSTSANAQQLLCELPAADDGALLETLKITIAVDGGVSVWHRWERTSYWQEHEKMENVLFHSMTTREGGTRFSVLVIESRFVDKHLDIDITNPPVVYLSIGARRNSLMSFCTPESHLLKWLTVGNVRASIEDGDLADGHRRRVGDAAKPAS